MFLLEKVTEDPVAVFEGVLEYGWLEVRLASLIEGPGRERSLAIQKHRLIYLAYTE